MHWSIAQPLLQSFSERGDRSKLFTVGWGLKPSADRWIHRVGRPVCTRLKEFAEREGSSHLDGEIAPIYALDNPETAWGGPLVEGLSLITTVGTSAFCQNSRCESFGGFCWIWSGQTRRGFKRAHGPDYSPGSKGGTHPDTQTPAEAFPTELAVLHQCLFISMFSCCLKSEARPPHHIPNPGSSPSNGNQNFLQRSFLRPPPRIMGAPCGPQSLRLRTVIEAFKITAECSVFFAVWMIQPQAKNWALSLKFVRETWSLPDASGHFALDIQN